MAPAATVGLAAIAVAVAVLAAAASAAVTYDRKAVVVNGQRRILLSGSIHYPRSVPEVRPRSALLAPPFPPPAVRRPAFLLSRKCGLAVPPHQFVERVSDCLGCVLASSGVQMWPDLIQKAKDGGLDVVQTYVFWNGHEPSPGQVVNFAGTRIAGKNDSSFSLLAPLFLMLWLVAHAQYYFEGRYDLVHFIKLVKQAGLYVHLRIGPYVCAEWNFG